MNGPPRVSPETAHYELRFQSLFDAGRAYAFPCDAAGHVDMGARTDRRRTGVFGTRRESLCRALTERRRLLPPKASNHWMRLGRQSERANRRGLADPLMSFACSRS